MCLGCLIQRQRLGDPLPQFAGRGKRGERVHASAVWPCSVVRTDYNAVNDNIGWYGADHG
jgi:hypothetical protein